MAVLGLKLEERDTGTRIAAREQLVRSAEMLEAWRPEAESVEGLGYMIPSE